MCGPLNTISPIALATVRGTDLAILTKLVLRLLLAIQTGYHAPSVLQTYNLQACVQTMDAIPLAILFLLRRTTKSGLVHLFTILLGFQCFTQFPYE